MSVLLRPQLEPEALHLCTAAVALAAIQACTEVAGLTPQLKWPNDLVVADAKLAGVLAEAEFEGSAVRSVVVGIGLNVAWPGPEGVGGTCLDDLRVGQPAVDRDELLAALLHALAPRRRLLDQVEGRLELAAELRQTCATVGAQVRVELGSETVLGRAIGIDDAGHLVVETPEGVRTLAAGDVVHLRPS
jgi:BirA family biotin operon repressor/biotin-[acetyl-CoA-carboxylase] ligase